MEEGWLVREGSLTDRCVRSEASWAQGWCRARAQRTLDPPGSCGRKPFEKERKKVKRDEEGYKGRARRRFAAARGRSRPPTACRLNLNKAAGFLGYIY